jgi:hypothetical protein
MSEMKLSREQIEKFVEIYDHFKEIQNFIVEHKEDGQIIVSFNLDDVIFVKDESSEQYVKQFVLDRKLNRNR